MCNCTNFCCTGGETTLVYQADVPKVRRPDVCLSKVPLVIFYKVIGLLYIMGRVDIRH
nr:MAG TPA: hypothetical protein [Caudoviricetes sp.]